MIHAAVLTTVTLVALYGICNAGKIGMLTVKCSHYRRQSNALTDEVIELRADLHEAQQQAGGYLERLRAGGML